MLAKDARPPLFLLRLSIFLVMAAWVGDKFFRPDHAADRLAEFYGLHFLTPEIVYGIGAVQAVILLAFLFGFRKRLSYGLVLLMHTVATFAAWPLYMHPFEGDNLLHFAAWPMWAALLALYALRDHDTLFAFRR